MISTEVFLAMISLLTTVGTAAWALFKVIIPRLVDAKIEATEFDRDRERFREDKMFQLYDRSLDNLSQAVSGNADLNSKLAARLDRFETLYTQQNGILAEMNDQLNAIRRRVEADAK